MTWPRLAGHGAGIQSITPFFSGGGIDSSAAAPFSFSPIIHMEYDRGPAFRLSNRATPSKLPAYRCPAPPVTRNLLHAPFFFLGGAPFISWPLTPGPSSPLVPPSLPSSLIQLVLLRRPPQQPSCCSASWLQQRTVPRCQCGWVMIWADKGPISPIYGEQITVPSGECQTTRT